MKMYFIVNTRHLITLIIVVSHPEIRTVTAEAGVPPWSLRLSCSNVFHPAVSRDTWPEAEAGPQVNTAHQPAAHK